MQDGISLGISLDMLNIANGIFDGQCFKHKEVSSQAQNGEESCKKSIGERFLGHNLVIFSLLQILNLYPSD